MESASFLLATALANVGFAVFVVAHGALTDRETGNWPYVTLVLGLAGVAGYFFYDGDDGAA
ncbi:MULTISPECIES: hypothetical protein [Natronococcus]|uniref:Uncharacterized protein n=1 Tax=Natronococcus jeotgali DSM 18795 TaxID=1227498 RepID=L9XU91_9EURY|nr:MULTISPECIES: hypothetical protein [Natronococcus]ELY65350.1 hypothetical protein C492_03516 [Natronococcus jeotgali DSM 18795]NKE37637.1 hypothetical protein [Natronococcus sp. JC468]